MKTWAKVLIGVLILQIVFLSVYCYVLANEAAKQEAVALMASESAEKARLEARRQSELAAVEARQAQNEAERLMEELLECKSKKQ